MKVLILGGDSDIARELIKLLTRENCDVIATTRRTATVDASISYEYFNASEPTDFVNKIPELIKDVDMVYSFIGYLPNEGTQLSAKEIEKTIQINQTSLMIVLDEIATSFQEKGSGKIIGVSSVAGERGKARNPVYSSAKAGFTAYLSGVRNKLSKSGVQVTTILPGFVSTKMVEGLELSKSLTVTPEYAAKKIYAATQRNKDVVYISGKWRLIMWIIRHIPEKIYKKMNF